ncbi:unnamed protein product, partial [Musa acuminata subsp. burmannicoides]
RLPPKESFKLALLITTSWSISLISLEYRGTKERERECVCVCVCERRRIYKRVVDRQLLRSNGQRLSWVSKDP